MNITIPRPYKVSLVLQVLYSVIFIEMINNGGSLLRYYGPGGRAVSSEGRRNLIPYLGTGLSGALHGHLSIDGRSDKLVGNIHHGLDCNRSIDIMVSDSGPGN